MTEVCPVCERELATVILATSEGKVRVGPQCSRMLEQLVKLMGAQTKRRPVLRVVR